MVIGIVIMYSFIVQNVMVAFAWIICPDYQQLDGGETSNEWLNDRSDFSFFYFITTADYRKFIFSSVASAYFINNVILLPTTYTIFHYLKLSKEER